MRRSATLLSWLFLRTWRRHPIRQALNVLSIALGVALFLSTELTTGSIADAVEQSRSLVETGVDLVVSRDVAGIGDAERAALAARPEFAGASGIVQVNAQAPDGTTLTLLGVDPVQDATVREIHASIRFAPGGPVRFALEPTSLLLTEAGLEHLGVRLGDSLVLTTASGTTTFTVAGALDPPGPPAVREALRDHGFLLLASAQRLFGRAGSVGRVELRLAKGVSIEDGERIAKAVVPGAAVSTPSEATREFLGSIGGFRTILILNSLLALLVAVFFIYNTVSASVAERARDAGLLRSIGLTRSGLGLLFAGEAIVSGLLGLLVGAVLGLALARGSLSMMVQTVRSLYFLVPPVSGLSLRASDVGSAALLSVGVAVLAALLASVSLARRKSLEMLRPAASGARAARGLRRAGVVGALLLAGVAVLMLVVPARNGRPTAMLVLVGLPAGIALVAPAIVLGVVGLLRRALARRARPPVWLALDAARTHPTRTAMTITAFALSLGLVIGNGGIAAAMIGNLSDWLLHTIPGELIVGGNAASPVSLFPFSDEALEPLRSLPGVASVFRIRNGSIRLGDGRKTTCTGLDLAVARGRSRNDFVAGDPADIDRRCVAGEAVFISTNLAWLAGLAVGDRVSIPSKTGVVELPIAGILRDFNSDRGTLYMDLSLYRRLFDDSLVDFGELCLEPHADVSRVAAAARAALPERYAFVRVIPREEFIGQILRVVEDLNDLSFVSVVLAVVIGSVGIVVTVTLSVLTRTRELALLRAVGMESSDLTKTVLYEVLGLAAASAVAGAVLGNLVFIPGDLLLREVSGFTFGYRFPAVHLGVSIVVAFATALAAAVLPLRHVRRLEVLAAMEAE